jgi:hypothetical protein
MTRNGGDLVHRGGGGAIPRDAQKIAVYSAPGVSFTLGAAAAWISTAGGVLEAADDLLIKKWANAI